MIIAPPQTPRLKTKLTLDIPSNYSNTGTPVSPSSPAFSASPAYNASVASVPASPTFSGSCNVSKSQAELTSLLKEAYGIIREKEKDLMLAAEIGKSLLENNIALKSKYESTIAQLQNLQRGRSIFTIHHGEKNAVPIAPPNNSLETFNEEPLDFEESDTESLQGWSSSFDPQSPTSSGETPFKRKNRDQNSSLTYKDLENIKELELRNQELQQQLDEAIREYNDSEKSSKNKVRKLESDLHHYQEVYSVATQKIEDLTKENERLVQKQKSDFWNLKYSKKSNENDDVIETLLQKVHELEEQNELVEKAKTEIERRLTRTTNELDMLKEEYEELYETSKECERLRMDNREKLEMIDELKESLEEQRIIALNNRSGIWSQKTSRANSISDGGSLMRNALRRLSDPDGSRDLFGGKPMKKTLLSELENEFHRSLQMFQRDVKKGFGDSDTSPPFSPLSSEKDLYDFFASNGARLDDDVSQLDYLSDSEFSFLDEFEVDNEKATRIREWFWKRWARAVYRFLRMIWRWCRFIVILIAAVLMALYRGPDDILPDEVYN